MILGKTVQVKFCKNDFVMDLPVIINSICSLNNRYTYIPIKKTICLQLCRTTRQPENKDFLDLQVLFFPDIIDMQWIGKRAKNLRIKSCNFPFQMLRV